MRKVTVDYLFTSDSMTDEQYDSQEEMEFTITEEVLYDILADCDMPRYFEVLGFEEVDNGIKVEYIINGDDMSDEEYEDQEEKTFTVTEDMIIEFMEDNISIPKGHEICRDNFYVNNSW